MSGFSETAYDLGVCSLQKPTKNETEFLANALVEIDPWKTIKTTAKALTNHFLEPEGGSFRYVVTVSNNPVGLISVKSPWLLGAYSCCTG